MPSDPNSDSHTNTPAIIPMQSVGPLSMDTGEERFEVMVPLATYETPLWPSVNRGARVTAKSGGIQSVLIREHMARSIAIETDSARISADIAAQLQARISDLQQVTETTSRFCKLLDIFPNLIGNQLFLRLEYQTGDASGHNMVTKASDALLSWILETFPAARYVSISGNMCTDKKVSAINAIRGRGKHIVADCLIPEKLVNRYLKTDAVRMERLNTRKNLLGSIAAGSLMSANAHAANMLLGVYLATGQDAANIVEGSQCITFIEARDGDLYISVTMPNLIVGAIGNGKGLDFVRENLAQLGCTQNDVDAGTNSRRLAHVIAGTVLCGELSLLAAQTNPGELMAAHLRLERKQDDT